MNLDFDEEVVLNDVHFYNTVVVCKIIPLTRYICMYMHCKNTFV